MSLNPIQICNQALLAIGSAPIVSLDDTSVESSVCRSCYDTNCQHVLFEYPWSCAIQTMQVTTQNAAPRVKGPGGNSDKYYTWTFPVDYLYFAGIIPEQDWFIEGTTLGFKRDGEVKYVTNQYPQTTSPVYLDDVVAAKMAADISKSLTGRLDVQGMHLKIYEAKLQHAIALEARTSGSASIALAQHRVSFWGNCWHSAR